MELFSADHLSMVELAALWNRAYEGYVMPLHFTEERMAAHLYRAGIDLRRSVIARVNGRVVGLSLAAPEPTGSAWIGGFGIVAEARRRGYATALMRAHLARLVAEGVGQVRLEVIGTNPARQVYRAAGFQEMRRLSCLEGVPSLRVIPGKPARWPLERLTALHRLHGAEPPVWRRSLPTLLRVARRESLELIVVTEGDAAMAYAVVLPLGDRMGLADAAARDIPAAWALLGAFAAEWPGLPLRMIDEPEGSPIAAVAADAGIGTFLRQLEMVYRP